MAILMQCRDSNPFSLGYRPFEIEAISLDIVYMMSQGFYLLLRKNIAFKGQTVGSIHRYPSKSKYRKLMYHIQV
jgi:hypothetical protein